MVSISKTNAIYGDSCGYAKSPVAKKIDQVTTSLAFAGIGSTRWVQWGWRAGTALSLAEAFGVGCKKADTIEGRIQRYLKAANQSKTEKNKNENAEKLKHLNIDPNLIDGEIVQIEVGNTNKLVILYAEAHDTSEIEVSKTNTILNLINSNKIDGLYLEGVEVGSEYKTGTPNPEIVAEYFKILKPSSSNLHGNLKNIMQLKNEYPGISSTLLLRLFGYKEIHGLDFSKSILKQAENPENEELRTTARDNLFSQTLINSLKNSNQNQMMAVMGAFHTLGVAEQLKANGISVIIIGHSKTTETVEKIIYKTIQSSPSGYDFSQILNKNLDALIIEAKSNLAQKDYGKAFMNFLRIQTELEPDAQQFAQKYNLPKGFVFSQVVGMKLLIEGVLKPVYSQLNSDKNLYPQKIEFIKAAEKYDKRHYFYLMLLESKNNNRPSDEIKYRNLYIAEYQKAWGNYFSPTNP